MYFVPFVPAGAGVVPLLLQSLSGFCPGRKGGGTISAAKVLVSSHDKAFLEALRVTDQAACIPVRLRRLACLDARSGGVLADIDRHLFVSFLN